MGQFTAEALEGRLVKKWSQESGGLKEASEVLKKCGNKIEIVCRAWLLHELNRELKEKDGEEGIAEEKNPGQTTTKRINNFAREEWNNRANKYFLEDPSRFEMIKGKIMRVSSKEIATELYFRLKAKEQTFDMASYIYGEGFERKNGGHINCCVKEFPYGLGKYVKQLKEGEIMKPIRIKGFFVLVELLKKTNASYNETVENEICMSLFGVWVERLVKQMVEELGFVEL